MKKKKLENKKSLESYYDNEIDLSKKKKKMTLNKKTKKIIILILISIIIIALIVALGLYLGNSSIRLWIDKYVLKKDIGEENLPKIEIDQSDNISIFAYGNYIATIENSKLTLYNNSANAVTTIDVSITTPKFYSNGKYLLVADDGGQNIYLIYNDSLQWHKEMEGDISQITVNKNGAVCVVLTGTTHKSIIIMYNINGNEEFRTYLASTIATDVVISEDNKYMSFVEVKTSGTLIESKVKTISIEKAKSTPSESIIYTYTTNSNTLILKIKYKNNKIVTYCDDSIHIFSEGNDEELLKFDNKVNFTDINLDGNICMLSEGKSNSLLSNEYELKILNVESRKEHTHIIKSAVKNLYCNDNIIAISLGNEVEFVNTSGWLIKKYTSIQNIRDITIGENIAGVIYKDKIEIISL